MSAFRFFQNLNAARGLFTLLKVAWQWIFQIFICEIMAPLTHWRLSVLSLWPNMSVALFRHKSNKPLKFLARLSYFSNSGKYDMFAIKLNSLFDLWRHCTYDTLEALRVRSLARAITNEINHPTYKQEFHIFPFFKVFFTTKINTFIQTRYIQVHDNYSKNIQSNKYNRVLYLLQGRWEWILG